jgi:alkylhydroperoxidase/carboxymuconolactone decarboxylase family protein YurZ
MTVDHLDPKTRALILFAIACKNQESMTMKYHFFKAKEIGSTSEELRAVVDLMRKEKIRFRRESEYVFKELFVE